MPENRGVIWITGLSAAGKTTLGESLVARLRGYSVPVVFLDGDLLRTVLGETSTHSREDRLRLASIYSRLCKFLVDQNLLVVISTVALFGEIHTWNRKNLTNYIEVFLDVPIDELIRRDPKGIYKRFRDGQIRNVAGLDLAVDFPNSPDFHFRFGERKSLNDMSEMIIRHLRENMHLAEKESVNE